MRRLTIIAILAALISPLLVAAPAHAVTEADCTIVGTPSPEVLEGTEGIDVICGLGGNDIIEGNDGDDIIFGGPGADSIEGGDGDDRIFGGPGADLLWGGDGEDSLAGADGNDGLTGGEGSDKLAGGADVDYCATDPSDISASSCFRDNAKPKVIALAYRKAKVSTDSDTVVRLRATIADPGTGVLSVGADVSPIQSPYTLSARGQKNCVDHAASAGEACLLSGTRNKGVWEFAFPIPAHTPARKFNQLSFFILDSASNQSYIEATGALAVSFSTTSTSPDAQAPLIESITSSVPTEVNAQNLESYEMRIAASDNLSGIRSLSVMFRSPACITAKQMQTKLCQNASTENDSKRVTFSLTEDGDYIGYLQISPLMFNGQWRLFSIILRDTVGNSREIWGSKVAVFNPPTFKITQGTATKISDVVSPLIKTVSISPKKVNTAAAAAIATVTLTISDNVGVDYVWASVIGPNSYSSEPEMSCNLSDGTRKNGTWTCNVKIPVHGATGNWRVVFLARDIANNTADLSPAVSALADNDGYVIKNG